MRCLLLPATHELCQQRKLPSGERIIHRGSGKNGRCFWAYSCKFLPGSERGLRVATEFQDAGITTIRETTEWGGVCTECRSCA